MNIRRFEKKDKDAVVAVHFNAMNDAGTYKGEGPWDDDLKNITAHYIDAGGEFLVGEEEDGQIVAIGAYMPDEVRENGIRVAKIKRIRTSPDRQRRGYAAAILKELERRAFAAGFRRLRLETTTAQTAAHALYRKLGFEEADRAVIMGYDCILFEKDLTAFKWLLFDIGGVLVRLGGLSKVIEWTGGRITAEEVGEDWLRSKAVRIYETGNMTTEEFAREIVAEFGFPVTAEEFLRVFDTFMGGFHAGAAEMLDLLTASFSVATLSNGNDFHWAQLVKEFDFEGKMKHNFLSFQMGHMKPDKEAFEIVLRELGCEPGEILFFDDNASNVKAAIEMGFKATKVVDFIELEKAIRDLGILERMKKMKDEMTFQRKQLANRKRRLIYNDDSDARRNPEAVKGGREGFLAERFNWVLGTQVDSYFWCVGNGMAPAFGVPDPGELGDADGIICDAAKTAGLEIIASLRMNDTHDSVFRQFLAPIKLERPDLLCAEDRKYPVDSILHLTWSAFDYAKEEVRKMRLDYIAHVCSKYDWDGLELDYCRFRRYFRVGEEEKNAPIMTDFIAEVRALLDRIGQKRGRPYLLAVRVPENIHYSRRLGLNIDDWVAVGNIDIMIAGDGLKPYSFPLAELIGLGRRFEIPVYSCISLAQFEPDNTGGPEIVERVRAAVSNRWLEDPDGIYIFNLCCMLNNRNPELAKTLLPLLNETGSKETLRGLDKIYESEAIPHWADWQINITPDELPARLIDDKPLTLIIGDPVEGAAMRGEIRKMTLRIRITQILPEENIEIRLNGNVVPVTNRFDFEGMKIGVFDHSGGTWFEADLTDRIPRQGYNEVRARTSTGSWGRLSTMVREVQLILGY